VAAFYLEEGVAHAITTELQHLGQQATTADAAGRRTLPTRPISGSRRSASGCSLLTMHATFACFTAPGIAGQCLSHMLES
jgi:hypothetical protein